MPNAALYLLLAVAATLSFWVSLVEATYLTVRPSSLMSAADDGEKRAKKAMEITENKTRLVSTTTLVDTICTVVLATTVGLILSENFGPVGFVYSTVLGSLLIMVFLYLLPKAIGIENATRMAISMAPSSEVLLKTLSPLAVPLTMFASGLSRKIVRRPENPDRSLVNEFQDFLLMLEKAGHVEPEAGKIIRSALSSSKSTAGEIMTPTARMVTIDVGSTVLEALKTMGKSNHPHLPVFDGSKATYVGAVTFRSLSRPIASEMFSDRIREYLIQPAKVDDDEAAAAVVDRMTEARTTMAFVFDQGKVTGMVTLTDIMEVVLGMKV
ncbi:MAG: CNNM domain-containing protein [Thaumarchaeota archaeon]|nr:CNNM domain-containing protein [Nitrososphaerota archaeon]